MVITSAQKNLLIGTLLGDGNLQTSSDGKTWRYRAIHKAIHEPYIRHKYDVLQTFCNLEPKLENLVDSRTEKIYSRFFFQTRTSDEFRYYGNLFYQKDEKGSFKKVVPLNIESLLTPEALAYWYMDDGALKWRGKSNAVRLCTDSFSTPEITLLKKTLEKKFSLKVSIQRKDNIQRLCILEESYFKLRDLVLPYLLPSMYYKFPDGNKGVLDDQDISNDIQNRLTVPKDENPLESF